MALYSTDSLTAPNRIPRYGWCASRIGGPTSVLAPPNRRYDVLCCMVSLPWRLKAIHSAIPPQVFTFLRGDRRPPLAPSTQPNDAMRNDAAMSSGIRSSLWLPVCRLLVASGELEWHWIWREGRTPTLQEPLDKVYLSAEAVKPDVVGTRLEEMRLNGTRISKETTNRRPTDNPRRKLENNL